MGLIREPRNVDFYIQSTPWTEEELNQLREIMKKSKATKEADDKRRTRVKKIKTPDALKL